MMLLHDQTPATTPFVPDWSIHPSIVIGVLALAALYGWAIGPGRTRIAPGASVEPWRPPCFTLGLLVLLFALNGPMHDLSDYYLFWIHMAQHLLLTMVLPPLLIAGLPGWLVDRIVAGQGMRRMARFLGHPMVAGGFFSVILLVWHAREPYDLMMRNHDVHVATHLMFIVAAVILWWPVMRPGTLLPRLGPGTGMVYLFLVQLPMQLLGAIITFADDPLYTWYVTAPRTWGLSPLDDQKLGGLLMWVPGNLWIWGAMSVLFFRWAKTER
ncbi:MAG: cytochrome c oxidase assembly protein [Gemmatimonadales bacterium]|nr:cytochrome c oxidase assembly protein [Gemmatimonadales bacterium]